jgi:hypothetical protein
MGRVAVAEEFSKDWQGMPGDPDIETDPFDMDYSVMDAFDRLQARRHEGRFAQVSWAGRGFDRPADDGEPVCYRSGIGVMIHGPGCCCESTT